MESRKRQRIHANIAAVPNAEESTINLNNLNSFILRNNQVIDTSGLDLGAGNLFFAVCDDNSNESSEYFSISNADALMHIKQEDESSELMLDGTCAPQSSSSSQYHGQNNCLSQSQVQNVLGIPKLQNNSTLVTRNAIEKLTGATTTVQLPSGCEIYLIKEVVEPSSKTISVNSNTELMISHAAPAIAINGSRAAAGVTPKTILNPKITTQTKTAQTFVKRVPADAVEISSLQSFQKVIRVNNCNNPNAVNTNVQSLGPVSGQTHQKLTVSAAGSAASIKLDNSSKKSCAFEAYKKRDDKRRATHNEVERRRRDKINSWIFKLKEMLPNSANSSNDASCSASQAEQPQQQQQPLTRNAANTSRSPPSDSKSQILIKACEYIKAMQDEIKSLRECLMENEKLRTSNQRLQNEINELKSEYQQNNLNNRNNNYNFFIKDDDDIITNLNIVDAAEDDDEIDNNRDHDEHILNSSNNDDHLFNSVADSTLINDTILAPKSAIATTTTSPVNILGKTSLMSLPVNAYTKRELIIRDYVD